MIKFKCTKCNEDMEAPISLKGEYLPCPKCDLPNRVPEDAPPSTDADQIKCPDCGSTQIVGDRKGFSGGKALGGALLLGPLGLLGGLHGSKKVKVSCMKCGRTWEPGK